MMSPAWLETRSSTPPPRSAALIPRRIPLGPGEEKTRAGDVYVEEPLPHPADHGWFVAGAVADHHPDMTLWFGDRPAPPSRPTGE